MTESLQCHYCYKNFINFTQEFHLQKENENIMQFYVLKINTLAISSANFLNFLSPCKKIEDISSHLVQTLPVIQRLFKYRRERCKTKATL